MKTGSVLPIPSGTRGFDCNRRLTAVEAQAMFNHGYRFAVRYVPRITAKPSDLSVDEIDHLFGGGLAVMPVQHVESESAWTPTRDKGESYGRMAAMHSKQIGIPTGTSCWLDLEGVATDFLPTIVERQKATIAYCNAWFHAVEDAGFLPGIYIGWHSGLTPDQLFANLAFRHYWGAYNLNRDEEPSKRGVLMRQGAATKNDVPKGLNLSIDTDMVLGDAMGGLPFAFAPDEWAV